MHGRSGAYLASFVAIGLGLALVPRGDGASPGLYGGAAYVDGREIQSAIERREEDLERARDEAAEIQARIDDLEREIGELEEERETLTSRARAAIIRHDRLARGGWLRVLLSSESLTEVAVYGGYYRRVLDEESRALEDLREKEDALVEKKAQLEEDRALLEKLEQDLETHKQELESRLQTVPWTP